jgi:hypothetical protein
MIARKPGARREFETLKEIRMIILEKERNMETQKRGLKPFVKGDSRINRKGRPKSFDELRKLGQAIAQETVTDKRGARITLAEAILRSWAESKEPILQKAFMEYAFGKVPDKLETPLEERKTLILHYGHELKRLENGSD